MLTAHTNTSDLLPAGYGMTESSPVVSFTSISKGSRHGSCGVLLPNTELKIISVDDGRVLDRGESGELCIRGPQVRKEEQ